MGDLVNYLAYMGEPAQADRKMWGILVLFALVGFFPLIARRLIVRFTTGRSTR